MKKADLKNDSLRMAEAYEFRAQVSSYPESLVYLDSAITVTRNSRHSYYPSSPYIWKSYYQYQYNDYEGSLENAIIGYQFAKKKGNVDQQISANLYMANVNSLWGNYRESLNLRLQCLALIEEYAHSTNPIKFHYIPTVSGIGSSYVRLRIPDSALYYFEKAIERAKETHNDFFYYSLVERSGDALYFKGDYQAALDSLNKGYHGRKHHGDYSTYPYYIGSIYLKQGKQEKGIRVFREIDSTYKANEVVYPELAIVYRTLKDHYKEEGNPVLQLRYLEDLLTVDSLIRKKEKYVKEKTIRDYRIPLLLEEREDLIEQLESKNKKVKLRSKWVLGALAMSLMILGYYIRQRWIYKKRFEALLIRLQEQKQELGHVHRERKNGTISEELWIRISESLKRFEQEKGYLSGKITLQSLAKRLKTNANYLSKVINTEKQMNFNSYINDLRVSASAKRLKEDETFRKYSIRAIAEESGFGSAEYFSKAFYKKYGIYPSYFIKRLDNV
ncbi:MAG: helix-turn-helix domain-containing protein [Bacteroidota bacterium]